MTDWRSQADVVGIHQLYAAGVSRDTVRWRLSSGRWQQPHPRVVALHSGPLTAEQQRWAALLWAGSGAVICGVTAAALDGLQGYEDMRVHVCVPQERRISKRPGIVVHRSAYLGPAEVHPNRKPRRTRVERSVVDLATGRTRADDAVAVLAAAVQQRLVTVEPIRQRLLEAPRLRHRQALLLVLSDLAGGSHSLPELEILRLIRRKGLPEPRRQYRKDIYGRVRYLDLFWDEYGLRLEVDGMLHLEVTTWWADIDRDLDISAGGVQVIRLSSRLIHQDPDGVIERLSRVLVARGWQAPPMKGVVGVLEPPRHTFDRPGSATSSG